MTNLKVTPTSISDHGPVTPSLSTTPSRVHQAGTLGTQRNTSSCTACHRITTGRTCQGWAGDAKDYGHEPTVMNALDRIVSANGLKTRLPGVNWQLAYWMPPGIYSAVGNWDQWHRRFGQAKETVLKCCAEVHFGINSPECIWEPVPG